MKVQTNHIEILLETLSIKTRQGLDFTGFEAMSDLIVERLGEKIRGKYLYENLYRVKEKAKRSRDELMNVQPAKLDIIAKFLGFRNYRGFVAAIDSPIHKVLSELRGNYYCYVRRNDKQGVILRSPVQIVDEMGTIQMTLKGPKWSFKGEMQLEKGCLFVLLKSDGGKVIHHVYKIGTREKPGVLQGIFSGVSTAFDPIGGRVVLIRMEGNYHDLRNEELKVSDLKKANSHESKSLATFFATYEDNNLSLGKITTFSLDDLLK